MSDDQVWVEELRGHGWRQCSVLPWDIVEKAMQGNRWPSIRKRMKDQDLAIKFKDEKDSLRIVFVCAMWMTGFDVESCGAIYLDKPMRNHTLMQTIARANRVFEGKQSGLIVDYVGVFRNLQTPCFPGQARSVQ